jgi:hypothetical protein
MTRFALILTFLAALPLVACVEERVVSTSFGVIKPPKEEDEAPKLSGGDAGAQGGYAIALDRTQGPQARALAESKLAQIAGQSGARDLWLLDDGPATIIFYGHYQSPDDPAARQDLVRWRQLINSGRVAASAALLVPVAVIPKGGNPEIDLRNQHGKGAYSLQVATFENTLPDFRKKAEQAAATLRRAGHDAYYFHGPNISAVTVGLFAESEVRHTPQGQVFSQRITATRGLFPNNVINALTPPPRQPGQLPLQPSILVKIP